MGFAQVVPSVRLGFIYKVFVGQVDAVFNRVVVGGVATEFAVVRKQDNAAASGHRIGLGIGILVGHVGSYAIVYHPRECIGATLFNFSFGRPSESSKTIYSPYHIFVQSWLVV